MKKLILILSIAGLLMGCYVNLAHSKHASGNRSMSPITIQTTTGQELIDLQQALDSGVITQEEYDEFKLKIIERLDAPVDSTDTINPLHELIK